MKQFILKNRQAFIGIGALLLIGAITLSFQDSPVIRQRFDVQSTDDDTLPEKNFTDAMKLKDCDGLGKELSKCLLQVGEELKKIDFTQIQNDVATALKDVDMKKIMSEVRSSLNDIKWDKMNEDISDAMADARKEIEKAKLEIRDIDKEAIEKTIEQTRKELNDLKVELKKIDLDKIMQEAKEGIGKAKEELKQLKTMLNEMEKDGLIDRKGKYSIEYKGKDLYINGKKQAESITDKYRKYFKEDHFKMNSDKEDTEDQQ